MESTVGDLTPDIRKLLIHAGPSAAANPKATPVCPPGLGAAGSLDGLPFEELDLDVLRSARIAGVPEEQLLEMQKVASAGKPRLGDLPKTFKPMQRNKNALSESEDDTAGGVAVTNIEVPEGADPMVTALAKLTMIADHLTAGKQKANTLDALLDGSGSGTTSDPTVASSTSRRSAAALRMLRRSLIHNPKAIYEAVENHMIEDFQVRTQLLGASAVAVSARAWLELRSKVQAYVTPVRLLWGIAGILDSLRAGAPEEACQGLPVALSGRSTVDRQRVMVGGRRVVTGRATADGGISESSLAKRKRTSIFTIGGSKVDGSRPIPPQRVRFPAGKEKEAEQKAYSHSTNSECERREGEGERKEQQQTGCCFRRQRCPNRVKKGDRGRGVPVEDLAGTPQRSLLANDVKPGAAGDGSAVPQRRLTCIS